MTFRAIPPLLASALWLAACSDAIPNADPADQTSLPAIEAPADPFVKDFFASFNFGRPWTAFSKSE